MADGQEHGTLPAHITEESDCHAVGGGVEGVADNTDSDDYDPSVDLQDSLQTSEQNSTASLRDTVVSPIASSLHPLPPKPVNGSSASKQTPSHMVQSNTPTAFVSPLPKMRGGFEVDDDDDDLEAEEDDDSKDVLDVYDPVEGADGDLGTPAPVPELFVDSVSPPAKQANGVALTASSKDAITGASGFVPSPLHPSVALPQRATSAIPVQNAADAQTQASPIATNVNASLAPAVPKARLAHDIIGILEDRIKEDPRGDIAAWLELIADLKSRNKQDEVRQLYDRFLKVFPLAVSLLNYVY
jgi:cleavage stimulation factor subunit 3